MIYKMIKNKDKDKFLKKIKNKAILISKDNKDASNTTGS